MSCPNCPKKPNDDIIKYGFALAKGSQYWTKIPEIKTCCNVKVTLVDFTTTLVTVEINGKQYTKARKEFMESSWRDIDSF